MSWIYLLIAGLFEIGWPVGIKLAQSESLRVTGIVAAILCMGLSGLFMWLAQKTIPMGTAYAVWTGIGAVGTAVLGSSALAALRWAFGTWLPSLQQARAHARMRILCTPAAGLVAGSVGVPCSATPLPCVCVLLPGAPRLHRLTPPARCCCSCWPHPGCWATWACLGCWAWR